MTDTPEAVRLAPSIHEMNYLAAMASLENVKAERDQLRAELEKVPTQLGYASMMGCEIFAGIFDAATLADAQVIALQALNATYPARATPPNADQKGQ